MAARGPSSTAGGLRGRCIGDRLPLPQ